MSYFSMKFRPDFKEPLLAGIKTCTSRTKRMCNPGDRFIAFGAEFEVLEIKDVSLYEVSLLWKEEGCTSQAHFIEMWNAIHPTRRYDEDQRVYLHTFKRVPHV